MNGPKQFMGAPQMARTAPQMRTKNPFAYMTGSIAATQKRRKRPQVPKPPRPY